MTTDNSLRKIARALVLVSMAALVALSLTSCRARSTGSDQATVPSPATAQSLATQPASPSATPVSPAAAAPSAPATKPTQVAKSSATTSAGAVAPAAGSKPTARQKGQEQRTPPWMAQLTQSQKDQIAAQITKMQKAGASRQEIMAATMKTLEGWGKLPRRAEGAATPVGGARHAQRWMSQLTPQQREQVNAKVKQMEEAGASREQIRTAVRDLAKGWGITMPETNSPLRAVMEKLTPAQRDELRAKMKQMSTEQKSPAEIRTAVEAMLKGWGVTLPKQ